MDGLIDDLEISAAREFLELHDREIGLDAGRVAVHDKSDRARRRDDGHLCVAVTMIFRRVRMRGPTHSRAAFEQIFRAMLGIDAERLDGELFVALRRGIVGSKFMIANDAKHVTHDSLA